jgi:hypothetical protein
MNLDFIKAHWPIFKPWCLTETQCQILPEGPELVVMWYRYCDQYNKYLDSLREIVAPEIPEGADQ